MTALPIGTVTFLFTDIEGSTRFLEARPETYRAALARHDAIIRQAVATHAGVIFQTRGDGFCAAFASPSDSIRAALDAQRALRLEPWEDGGSIKARMGLHTGEVELQNGEYFGQPLHRCARLMDSAHGGQVVLSAAAQTLVGDALPPGVRLTELGQHHLRDIARPEHLYQLTADDLPSDFPPLRTASRPPNNLPTQATAFVGRERQIQVVCGLLLRPDTRLLTLTGPGGTGKTRLSIQVAAALAGTFVDGVFFVPLASLTDPDLVLSSIAQTLDVSEVAGRPIAASLGNALRQKQLLLVLDNFEQVVSAAPSVAALLAAAPGLKALVTSRAALRLYGEREYPVPPLALPDRRAAPSATHLAQYESITLFVDRAQDARPDFALSDQNAGDVAEICQRLDGLPLAIELAAARIRALTPAAMLQRMERRLPLLTGGARDLPARQRTLRDTIAWSYDLLDPDEQALFRRLGVFRGCTLEAAETVCAGEPARPGATTVALPPLDLLVLDGIESLVEKSLVHQDQGADGQPWYRMLETVREFALERLEETGESGAVHRRHALTALKLAESLETGFGGAEETRSHAHLEHEHENLRGALRWCQEHGYAEPSLRLAIALWPFWAAHGHIAEGRERLDMLLTRFPSQAAGPRAVLAARALYAAATLASIQGDLARARTVHEEALSLRRAHGDRNSVRASLEGLGLVLGMLGDYADARDCLEEGRAIARELQDPIAESTSLSNLGNVAYEAGDLEGARSYFEAVNVLLDAHDVRLQAIGADLELARIAHDLGDYDEAEALATRARKQYQDTGYRRMEVLALAMHGGIDLERGDRVAARSHLTDGITICRELGDAGTVAQVLERFVELAAAYGHHAEAVRLAGAATSLRERVGAPRSRTGQLKLDEVLGPARNALSGEVAEAAWQAGLALGMDEAVAAALALTEPGLPPDPHAAMANDAAAAKADLAATVLTRREQEVAALIGRGLTNRQISEALVITEGTAANHVNHILDKLAFSSRAQIAVWAVERGLL
jgi:predicted ATPase/class 3 adenylate cyclase/DNA-binding CsgD family transcriptional regulator/Tfp pilus assembly protein PilF